MPPELATWEHAPAEPSLSADEVHVWRASLDLPAEDAGRLDRLLSSEERDRRDRLRPPLARVRFSSSRGWLRYILARYVRTDPACLAFRFSERGKPSLSGLAPDLDLHFNLSHSSDLALIAVSLGREVGVDVEHTGRGADTGLIARRCFTSGESAWLDAQPAGENLDAFYRCWTRKEACAKACGEGLRLVLRRFDADPGVRGSAFVQVHPAGAGPLSLCSLDPGPGYVGALAVRAGPCRLKFWDSHLPANALGQP